MQTTYAQRLRRAIAHAGISQAELARRLRDRGVQVEQQAIQYLAKEENHARGSKHTSAIADECGVESTWLQTGQGDMLPAPASEARDSAAATYRVDSAAALVKKINRLKPEVRQAVAALVSSLSTQDTAIKIPLSAGEMRAEESARVQKTKRARAS